MKKMKSSSPVSFASNLSILAGFWLLVSSFFFVIQAEAGDYIQIDLWPPHPGVFSDVGQQQFTAYGITAAGQRVNITDQVDWYLAAYPFQSQELEPYEVATIDENGLLTINEGVTWGRVTVKACYPKGCGPVVAQYKSGRNLMNSISILLTPKFLVTSSATAGGSIGPAGTMQVKKGTVEDFTLTPDECYELTEVNCTCGGALDGTGSTYTTDSITEDCSVEAVFSAMPDQTATPSVPDSSGSTADPAATVACGGPVNFTFTANNAADIATLNGADTCGGTLTDLGGGNWDYDIPSLSNSCTAAVKFVPQYTVTPKVANGTVDPTPKTAGEGSQVVFTYTPTNTTCDIAQVDATNDTCGGAVVDNQNGTWDYTYTIANPPGDCDAAVEFVTPDYTVTPSAVNGSYNPVGPQAVACGGTVTYTFTPTPGYDLASIDGTDSCGGNLNDNGNGTWDYTIDPLTGDCNAAVRFDSPAPAQYTLNINSTGGTYVPAVGGIVTSNPAGIECSSPDLGGACTNDFDSGTDVQLTVTYDSGTTDFVWSGDCCNGTNNSPCTVTMDGPKNCTATFSAAP